MFAWMTRQDGLFCMMSFRWFRVRYPDGQRSITMPLGNAQDYKGMFGGSLEYTGPLNGGSDAQKN